MDRELSADAGLTGERLCLALESGRAVGWDWDVRTGRDVWFGDLKTLFGISTQLYEGRVEDFRRLIHPDDRELVWRAVSEARLNRTLYRANFRLMWPDGTVRWAAASGTFHYAADGEAVRMLGIAADITEQIEAWLPEGQSVTERRRADEARLGLAAIVESSNDSIVSIDLDGTITSWNAGAQSIFGWSETEVIGKPMTVLVPPGMWDEEEKILERVKAGERIEHYETLRVTKAGTLVNVSLRVSPVRDAAGRIVGASKISRDITEREPAAEVLHESEGRFRHVVDTAPVMLWMSGTDRLCTYFNREWLEFTGRTLEAELGDGWAEGLHPADLDGCLKTYTSAFDRREPFRMENRFRRHDGEYRWVLGTGAPRFTDDGSFAGYIGSGMDVTKHRLANEVLSGLSHKLIDAHETERRTIARELQDDVAQRVALLTIELERLGQAPPKRTTELRLRVRELCGRAIELEKDVQNISRRLHPSKLEYLGVAAAADAFCKDVCRQREVEIDFSHDRVPEDLGEDVGLVLFRVLQEALGNAVKHAGVKHFTVALRGSGNQIQLEVADAGIGFDPEAAMKSHGLGLSSMRERLRLIKGEVVIESRPGAGTRIRARVPLSRASAGHPDEPTGTHAFDQTRWRLTAY